MRAQTFAAWTAIVVLTVLLFAGWWIAGEAHLASHPWVRAEALGK